MSVTISSSIYPNSPIDIIHAGIMRVILTARQGLASVFEAILGKLISILGIMSKNPSNPNFAQYTFESVSALIR
jgi:exportin-2 (importin alpha re-exporter)